MPSASVGDSVSVETILLLNPFLKKQREIPFSLPKETLVIPEGYRAGGVGGEEYGAYRKGLDSACADVVLTTRLADGTPAVLSSRRAPGKLFGNKWWMQGGGHPRLQALQ